MRTLTGMLCDMVKGNGEACRQPAAYRFKAPEHKQSLHLCGHHVTLINETGQRYLKPLKSAAFAETHG